MHVYIENEAVCSVISIISVAFSFPFFLLLPQTIEHRKLSGTTWMSQLVLSTFTCCCKLHWTRSFAYFPFTHISGGSPLNELLWTMKAQRCYTRINKSPENKRKNLVSICMPSHSRFLSPIQSNPQWNHRQNHPSHPVKVQVFSS